MTDLGLLVLREVVAVIMLAHGWNHAFGGGRITGTARWFESLGMRPGLLHACVACLSELGAGLLLLLGLATPLAGGAVIGVMTVALISNHARNGFFIFRPGEGYEYVLLLTACGVSIACSGGGSASLDAVVGLGGRPAPWLTWLSLLAGLGGAVLTLALFWRPSRPRRA